MDRRTEPTLTLTIPCCFRVVYKRFIISDNIICLGNNAILAVSKYNRLLFEIGQKIDYMQSARIIGNGE